MLESIETIAFFVGDDGYEYEIDHLGRTDREQDWGKCTVYRDRRQCATFLITPPTLRPGRLRSDMPASAEELRLLAQNALDANGFHVQLTPRP